MARKPTIADVAERAGVSKGLVSLAVNRRPGVATGTRDRILQAAEALGWQPSVPARSLSTRRAYALGLVVRRHPEVMAADPFLAAFIAGVESVLPASGQVLVLSMVPDWAHELATYQAFERDHRVDGVFLTDLRPDDERMPVLTALGIPAVAIGHPEPPVGWTVVNLDDTIGISQAVRHLATLGHTRIAHVAGDQQMLHGMRRRRTFEATMAELGLRSVGIIDTDFSAAAGAAATATLLDQPTPPTAIVFASDPLAIAGMNVAQERGVVVPDQLSVTGFDGSELGRHVFPRLTTVIADPVAWGAAAAHSLLGVIAGEPATVIELPSAQLVPGGSSGPPPSNP